MESAEALSVAVAWYEPKDAAKWKELDALFDFDFWQRGIERTTAALVAGGIHCVRVPVRPSEFTAWADERGLDYSADNRRAYAAHLSLYGQCVALRVPTTRFL